METQRVSPFHKRDGDSGNVQKHWRLFLEPTSPRFKCRMTAPPLRGPHALRILMREGAMDQWPRIDTYLNEAACTALPTETTPRTL